MTKTETYFPELRKAVNLAKSRVDEFDYFSRKNIVHPRWREDGPLEEWQIEAMLKDELESEWEDADRLIKGIADNHSALSPAAVGEFHSLTSLFAEIRTAN
jgi:hypothetical protein